MHYSSSGGIIVRGQPGKKNPFLWLFLAGTLFEVPLLAEPNKNQSIDFNPSYPKASKSDNDSRDKKADDSSDKAKQSMAPLLNNAANHNRNAEEHRKKADQLQQSNPGAADQERKKAAIEQQKANQLQKQAEANKKNSEDNKKAADAARDSNDEPKAKQLGLNQKIDSRVEENKVIVVDEGKKSEIPLTPHEERLKKEIATLEDYIPPVRPTAAPEVALEKIATASEEEPPPTAPSFLRPEWESALTNGPAADRETSSAANSSSPESKEPQLPPPPSGAMTLSATTFDASNTPLILKRDTKEDNGLEKDFFKPKKKPKNKKVAKRASRALASKGKEPMVKRIEATLVSPETLPEPAKLKD